MTNQTEPFKLYLPGVRSPVTGKEDLLILANLVCSHLNLDSSSGAYIKAGNHSNGSLIDRCSIRIPDREAIRLFSNGGNEYIITGFNPQEAESFREKSRELLYNMQRNTKSWANKEVLKSILEETAGPFLF
jgi:hypothetical protein